MINYDEMTVQIGPNGGNIKEFVVWWMIPGMGLTKELFAAKEHCRDNNIPSNLLRPVVVAMCDNGLYEVIF